MKFEQDSSSSFISFKEFHNKRKPMNKNFMRTSKSVGPINTPAPELSSNISLQTSQSNILYSGMYKNDSNNNRDDQLI